jgi:predicted SnoaL-like aldol condensation-catalyzing enzyme
VDNAYFVTATTLDLREAPSATAQIVRTLERTNSVTIIEMTNTEWVKVRTFMVDEAKYVEGYIVSKYLTKNGGF